MVVAPDHSETSGPVILIWATTWQNQENDLCAKQRLRSAWGICPVWSESSLSAWRSPGSLATHRVHWAKTLIRLGWCPGWSESSLDEQLILLVLSCSGSFCMALWFLLWAEKQIRRVFDDNFPYFSIETYVVGDSNEYPQHMFLRRTDKNYPLIIIKYPPYLFHWYKALCVEPCFVPGSQICFSPV